MTIKSNLGVRQILFLIVAFLIFTAGCIQVKKVSLYDGVEPEPEMVKPKEIAVVVEPTIYYDAVTDVWGLEKDICQDNKLSTDIVYTGESALELKWDRGIKGCKFAAIGIGWDGYAGKDLTQIIDYAAIEMYVRSKEGRMFGLPIVLTLEDYSGGMGFAYTGNKYFERSAIDEEWQRVIVPLNAFDMEVENLDPSNIKQLQLELQQSGHVYIDDIKLVFYEPEPQEPWMVEEELPSPIETPIQIFGDEFINGNSWGLFKHECQDIKLTSSESSEGNKSVEVSWNNPNNECRLTSFGASWNKWKPVDLTPILSTAAIQLKLKMKSGSADSLPIKCGFEDYDRAISAVELTSTYVQGGRYSSEWKTVIVPLSAIPEKVDFTRIKHLGFYFEGTGDVYIDDISLVQLAN